MYTEWTLPPERERPELTTSAAEVRAALGKGEGVQLLDARAVAQFTGRPRPPSGVMFAAAKVMFSVSWVHVNFLALLFVCVRLVCHVATSGILQATLFWLR